MAPFSKSVVGLVLLGLIVVSTAADSSGSETVLQTVDVSSRALASNLPHLDHRGSRALLRRVLSSKKSKKSKKAKKSKKFKKVKKSKKGGGGGGDGGLARK